MDSAQRLVPVRNIQWDVVCQGISSFRNSMIMSSNRLLSIRKLHLLRVDQVPPESREVAILNGYRSPQCTLVQCVASVFNPTNETLNFWTHFIPTWYFVWQLSELAPKLYTDSYTWAFLSCMLTCCVYPLTSCVAHAFSSLSEKARHICYFFDYAALSLYSYGVAVLYRAYSFPDTFLATGMADNYLLGSFCLSALGTLMACVSRFATSLVLVKFLRLGAFTLPYIWESLPLAYRIYQCQTGEETGFAICQSDAMVHHYRQFVVAFLGAFAYASHMPERLAPGKFDIVGHSHQLLHVCAVMATYEQMSAALIDMRHRRDTLAANGWMLNYFWSWLSVPSLLLIDAVIITLFIIRVMQLYDSQVLRNQKRLK